MAWLSPFLTGVVSICVRCMIIFSAKFQGEYQLRQGFCESCNKQWCNNVYCRAWRANADNRVAELWSTTRARINDEHSEVESPQSEDKRSISTVSEMS